MRYILIVWEKQRLIEYMKAESDTTHECKWWSLLLSSSQDHQCQVMIHYKQEDSQFNESILN